MNVVCGEGTTHQWLVRAPIVVFRLRLGLLFGGRLLLLEHVGRRSGQPRQVVLECVERSAPRRIVIASGFGDRSQWYRNLLAHPECHVSIGTRHRVPAVAWTLTSAETSAVRGRYREQHRAAYRELSGVVEESIGQPIESVPMVELELR